MQRREENLREEQGRGVLRKKRETERERMQERGEKRMSKNRVERTKRRKDREEGWGIQVTRGGEGENGGNTRAREMRKRGKKGRRRKGREIKDG